MARNRVRRGGNVLDMGSVETLTGDVLVTLGQPVRQVLLRGLLGDIRSISRDHRQ